MTEYIETILRDAGLIGHHEVVDITILEGGVSSAIWKVEAGDRTLCIKQALARLKVQAQWHAPVERNRFEVRWNQVANRIASGSAPPVRYHDDERMFFVMDYLDPEQYPLWKERLRQGHADRRDAGNVGRTMSFIHSQTAGDAAVAALFPRSDIFHDIRLEPYLLATAQRHPDLKSRIEALSRTTAETRLTMIHGDVSPKNILIGPDGPVFLDAECACIGDPAFDIAFCLNHMLLKCLWNPAAAEAYLACFQAMTGAYLQGVNWEHPATLEARAAALLPALFLARVDGKSPVEYITEESDRDRVRRCARSLLETAPTRLDEIRLAWEQELNG